MINNVNLSRPPGGASYWLVEVTFKCLMGNLVLKNQIDSQLTMKQLHKLLTLSNNTLIKFSCFTLEVWLWQLHKIILWVSYFVVFITYL